MSCFHGVAAQLTTSPSSSCSSFVDATGCRYGGDIVGKEIVLPPNLSLEEQQSQCAQHCCETHSCNAWAVHENYSESWSNICNGQACCLVKHAGWFFGNEARCTSGGKTPFWKGVDCNGKTYSGGPGKDMSPCQPDSRPTICPWTREAPYTSLSNGGCSSNPQEGFSGDVCDLNTCKINWKGTKCGSKPYEAGAEVLAPRPCTPQGTASVCPESAPFTSLASGACSNSSSEPFSGAVCDTATCKKDWRGVDCKGKVYTGGNGIGLSPCRPDGRPSICPYNRQAPFTSLASGGCSNDHSINWSGDVCDLNTCILPAAATTQLNLHSSDDHNDSSSDQVTVVFLTVLITAAVMAAVAFVVMKVQNKRREADVVELEPVVVVGSSYGSSCSYSMQANDEDNVM